MATTMKQLRRLERRAGVRVMANADGQATTKRVAALQGQRAKLLDEGEAIADKADRENRALTQEENERVDKIGEEVEQANAQIANLSRVIEQQKAVALARAEGAVRDEFGNPIEGAAPPPDGKPRMSFRNQHGEVVHALSSNQPLARAQAGHSEWPRPSLGDAIAARLTGDAKNYQASAAGNYLSDDGSGGWLVDSTMFAPAFDLARPNSVAFKAGALTLPMDTSRLELVQLLQDPSVQWTPELGRVPSSRASFGRVVLQPKKLAAIVPVSLEMIEDAANAGTLLQQAIQDAMAVALDQAILSGTGVGPEPRGVRNEPAVNTVDATNEPVDFVYIEDAVEKVMQANYGDDPKSLAWVANPRDASRFNRLTADDGQPLRPTPGAEALNRYQTTSLPIDLGAGSDEGEMIIGDFTQVLVGMRTNATVRFSDSATVTDVSGTTIDAGSQFARLILVHMRADVAVMRPSWLTVVKGVSWT